jgi:tetratricopeptide (TPR) repeat protein
MPTDSAELSQIRSNLGTALADRYEIGRAAADLDEAIANFQAGATRVGRNSAPRATHLDNLATALRERHQATGDLRSLDEAIAAHRQALRLTPSASADRVPRLSNYAASLMAYATARGSRRHAAWAIRALRRAVGTTSPQDVNWPRYVGNLANALRQRHEWIHSGGDLQEAIRLYRQTCESGIETATAVAFYAARDWAGWAASRRAWSETGSAYEFGVQAMERLLGVQIARHDQETWLRAAQSLPAEAGYAYACAGDLRVAALVIERFRAVLWTLALADLDRMGRPDLAERYRRAAARLTPLARN